MKILMIRPAIAILFASAILLLPASGSAADPFIKDGSGYELKNNQWWFLTSETALSGALWAVMYFAVPAPTSCRWCRTNAFDDRIRTALRASDPVIPANLSDAFVYGLLPAGAIAAMMVPAIHEKKYNWIWQDFWISANSVILTMGIQQGIKKAVGRQRPAFHYGVQSKTYYANKPEEENVSFYSGHTATAFAMASSATTIAFLRGYKSAPYIAAFGGAAAVTVGILRISADVHWASDVIVGAAAGTLIGAGLPLLLHNRIPGSPLTAITLSPIIGQDVKGITFAGNF